MLLVFWGWVKLLWWIEGDVNCFDVNSWVFGFWTFLLAGFPGISHFNLFRARSDEHLSIDCYCWMRVDYYRTICCCWIVKPQYFSSSLMIHPGKNWRAIEEDFGTWWRWRNKALERAEWFNLWHSNPPRIDVCKSNFVIFTFLFYLFGSFWVYHSDPQ